MPKQKSRKSLTNRIKVTKNGKLLRRQSFRRHLKAGKSHKRLSHLKRQVEVIGFYAKKLSKAMGVKRTYAKKLRKAMGVKKSK